jgi:hypothetical protein
MNYAVKVCLDGKDDWMYIKSSMCQVHMHVVRDGEMVESTE